MSRGKGGKSHISSTIKKLKQIFKRLPFPVTKKRLIEHARSGGGGDAPVNIASELSASEYEHFSDLAAELDKIEQRKRKEE